MAALMITAPLLALLVFRRADRAAAKKNGHEASENDVIEREPPALNSEEEEKA
jgi:hypothetical protein